MSLVLPGCKARERASLQQQWVETRSQLLRGYVNQALNGAEKGYEDSGQFPELNWKFRILLADAQTRKNQTTSALQLLASSPPSTLPAEVTWNYVLSRSYTLCRAGMYQDSDIEFRKAQTLTELDRARLTELATFHGLCELQKRDFETANALLRQAESGTTSDQFMKLYAAYGLGVSAMRTREYEEATKWFLIALKREELLQALPLKESAQGNLGFIYFELGDFEEARKNSEAAAEGAAEFGIFEHEQSWLLDTGRAYAAIGQSGVAEEYYRKALLLARKTNSDDIAATALHNLTSIRIVKGDLKQAAELHAEMASLKLRGNGVTYYQYDDARIAASSHNWTKAERQLLQLVPIVRSDARQTWFVEAELARVYAGQGRPRSADEWFQRSIKTMAKEAARRRNITFTITTLDSWPIFDDYIAFLYTQRKPARALQVAQSARARTLAEQLGLKSEKEEARSWLRRIQAMLRTRHSVLLAYYEAEHDTYAWIVTGKTFEMKALGVNQNDLETLADEYRTEIDNQAPIDSSPAQQKLYQLLVKPLARLIPKGSHVILVGDSALYRINFEALVSDAGAPHYWIDDVELENASSIDLLLATTRVSRHGKGGLIIGAPKQVSPQYPLLPHAPEEVADVKAQFKDADVKVFEGVAATPDAYISSQPSRFKYIEFATHSDASSSDPLKSTIILSTGPSGSFQLSAGQIVKTSPRLNAELVSISGCYSGGKVRTSAEGLLGLQWAFMRAGAHQVVAGLWDVDDKSSPQLMGGLYAGIVHGESAAAALRAAKLKMLHSGKYPAAPYYWASLQLYTGL